MKIETKVLNQYRHPSGILMHNAHALYVDGKAVFVEEDEALFKATIKRMINPLGGHK